MNSFGNSTKTAGAAPKPLYDLQSSLERLDGDQELFRKLAEFFLEDSPALLNRIRTGISTSQLNEVERAAHSLKSLAANFGAYQATEAARQLEDLGRLGDLSEAAQVWPNVELQMQQLRQALAAYLAGSKS